MRTLVFFLAAVGAIAQSNDIPRMPDGKPDFNGVWDHPRVADVTRNGKGCGGNTPGCTQTGTGEHPSSEQLRVTERIHYIDPLHLSYEVTWEDPKTYTKPIKNTRVLSRMKPGDELMEYWCMENNKDLLEGHLSR